MRITEGGGGERDLCKKSEGRTRYRVVKRVKPLSNEKRERYKTDRGEECMFGSTFTVSFVSPQSAL